MNFLKVSGWAFVFVILLLVAVVTFIYLLFWVISSLVLGFTLTAVLSILACVAVVALIITVIVWLARKWGK